MEGDRVFHVEHPVAFLNPLFHVERLPLCFSALFRRKSAPEATLC